MGTGFPFASHSYLNRSRSWLRIDSTQSHRDLRPKRNQWRRRRLQRWNGWKGLATRIIVIGASTGGPQALRIVLKGLLPVVHRIPVLVALHIPPEFTQVVAEGIEKTIAIPVHTARDEEKILKGHIYLSPGNLHLGVGRNDGTSTIELFDGPPENFCKPSVDALFRTTAVAYGAGVIGIFLTGMGSDGRAGAGAICEAGGFVIAQDAASSAVWGMPRSVIDEGMAHAALSLDEVGRAVCHLLQPIYFQERQI